jgi:hypothetical protein
MAKKTKPKADSAADNTKFPLPVYDKEDDIYRRSKEVSDNPGDKILHSNEKSTGEDLDVPGSELDDTDEIIGEEDEENNYYSLGGDRHEDLEEDNG